MEPLPLTDDISYDIYKIWMPLFSDKLHSLFLWQNREAMFLGQITLPFYITEYGPYVPLLITSLQFVTLIYLSEINDNHYVV